MLEKAVVILVVLIAAYWILRKVFRQLAQEDGTLTGCEGCTGCSLPPEQKLEKLRARRAEEGSVGTGQCCSSVKSE